jgi:N-methylhydantoinase B
MTRAVGTRVDAITVEVVNQSLAGIVQEMQNSLFCTGYSTIIRESRDASCAIMDATGQVLAQFTVLPLHLGAFPACVQAIGQYYDPAELADGDAILINHPYVGGSPHATDMAIISPVITDGQLFGYCGSIAHKSDIGGMVPGSNSGQAREIFHEGLMVPPVLLYRSGHVVREVEAIVRANSRTPELVMGDLRGQVGATHLGARRLITLLNKYGSETLREATESLLRGTERRVRAAIASWPDGVFDGTSALHNDGVESGRPVRARVRVTIAGDRILFDFRDSDDQASGPYNIRPPLVRAACYYSLKCLIGADLSSNGGLAAAVDTEFRPGSVLDPHPPAPVNTYMPMAIVTTEAIFDALSTAVPRARIAESAGGGATSGILSHSSHRTGYPQVQYDLLANAMGARYDRDGVSASTVHVSNAGITPIEIVESEFPVEVVRFELRRDSGGAGQYRGGLGFEREYRMLGNSRFTQRGGQQLSPAAGRDGGHSSALAQTTVNPGDREKVLSASDGNVTLGPGDVLRIQQAGSGGYGDPLDRPVEDVLRDVCDGYVSPQAAHDLYGVTVTRVERTWVLDERLTQQLRATRSQGEVAS